MNVTALSADGVVPSVVTRYVMVIVEPAPTYLKKLRPPTA